MKNLIIIVILCFAMRTNAQYSADSLLLTKTEWINKDLDYLRFFKDSVVSNISESKQQLIFDLDNKKLSFKAKYRVGGSSLKTEEISFKIKSLNKNKLVIEPLDKKEEVKMKNFSKLNSSPFLKEKQFIFYNRGELLSRVKFKKITFHASTCFGTCPSMSVEVNIDGTVFYQGRIFTKEFTGNFTGKLSATDLYELRRIVNRSQLQILDQKWKQTSKPNDTPRYNYIIEMANGALIEINTNDQHPILDKLSEFFINIPKIADLVVAKEKHIFDESHIDYYKVSHN